MIANFIQMIVATIILSVLILGLMACTSSVEFSKEQQVLQGLYRGISTTAELGTN